MANLPFITAGTINFTNGSAAITGSGTTFNQFIANATTLNIYDTANNKTHQVGIASITDDTNATIQGNWPFPSLTGASYFAQVLSSDVAGLQEAAAKLLTFIDSVNSIATAVNTLEMAVNFAGTKAVKTTADGTYAIISTSTNGTTFTDRMKIHRTTGEVHFVNNVGFGNQTDPSYPVDATGKIRATTGFLSGTTGTISDDAVAVVSTANFPQSFFISVTSNQSAARSGLFHVVSVTGTTTAVNTVHTGGFTQKTTGVLTGTTGTDSYFTFSATDTDIYFENRAGGPVVANYTILM